MKFRHIKGNYVFRLVNYYQLGALVTQFPLNYINSSYHANVKAKIAQYHDIQMLKLIKNKTNCSIRGISCFSNTQFKAALDSP